uniref:protein rolling stone n=1 Tax=Pristiophorus japonicus TaxID=55135 RepID=UPI00398E7D76
MGASWTKHFKQEFSLEKCSPRIRDPQLILRSQWRLHSAIWLFYRIFMATYTLVWCICSAVQTNTLKWFIFLTHLTYITLTIYFILALVNLICYITLGQKKPIQNNKTTTLEEMAGSSSAIPEVESRTPSLGLSTEFYAPPSALYPTICVQWVLHNITCAISLYVTVAFWSFDYSPGKHKLDSININMHVINSVFVLLELGLTAAPVHLAHLLYILAYSVSFIIFSAAYWAAGGTNQSGEPFIYSILNYGEKPAAAAICVIGSICVLLPLFQFLVWNLHFLRRHVLLKLHQNMGDTLEN